MNYQLIINAGSATVKYSLFKGEKKFLAALYEKKGKGKYALTIDRFHAEKKEKLTKKRFDHSLKDLLGHPWWKSALGKDQVKGFAFRVVHGGSFFRKPTKISPSVLKKLKLLDELAPLHNPYARRLIEVAEGLFPGVPKIAIFDTAFHSSIPEVNWRYALPRNLTDQHHLRRFGFHGIVCSSIVDQLKRTKKLSKRLIICHLGSGCSITAVKGGKSIDTSMGFTPLEGVVMGTRAGDLDPGLLLFLLRKLNMNPRELSEMLHHDSGLKGLTGKSDMREVLQLAKKGDRHAQLALEIFCSKVAKTIAALTVSLGGLDRIVFSGGIGENSPVIRRRIGELLRPLGLKFKINILHADEDAEMNRWLRGVDSNH